MESLKVSFARFVDACDDARTAAVDEVIDGFVVRAEILSVAILLCF